MDDFCQTPDSQNRWELLQAALHKFQIPFDLNTAGKPLEHSLLNALSTLVKARQQSDLNQRNNKLTAESQQKLLTKDHQATLATKDSHIKDLQSQIDSLK